MGNPLAPLHGNLPQDWHCWVGVGGVLYARYERASPPILVAADSADALRTKIAIAEIDIWR